MYIKAIVLFVVASWCAPLQAATFTFGDRYILAELDSFHTWDDANNFSQSTFSTELASITDAFGQAEAENLLDALPLTGFGVRIWFGGFFPNPDCGTIEWLDGTTSTGYTNWNARAPDSCLTNRVFAMDDDGDWFNLDENSVHTFALIRNPAHVVHVPTPPLAAVFLTGALLTIGARARRRKAALPVSG